MNESKKDDIFDQMFNNEPKQKSPFAFADEKKENEDTEENKHEQNDTDKLDVEDLHDTGNEKEKQSDLDNLDDLLGDGDTSKNKNDDDWDDEYNM